MMTLEVMFQTTGCEPAFNLRREFRGCDDHLDAPSFIATGSSGDDCIVEMSPREDWKSINEYSEGHLL